jgi:hypothetical protein
LTSSRHTLGVTGTACKTQVQNEAWQLVMSSALSRPRQPRATRVSRACDYCRKKRVCETACNFTRPCYANATSSSLNVPQTSALACTVSSTIPSARTQSSEQYGLDVGASHPWTNLELPPRPPRHIRRPNLLSLALIRCQ